MELKFANLIPPLNEDEYSKLEQSILKEGCRDALIVWMKTETIWRCPECSETFDDQVIHCLHCSHHWMVGAKTCKNCYKSLHRMPRAVKTTNDAFNEIILIDGHNRYEICTRYEIKFKTQEIHFDNDQAAEIWILINQLSRRNLTDDQRAIITDELIERQSKVSIAKQRGIAGKAGGRGRPKLKNSGVDAPSTPLKERVRTELSKKAKVSERKVKKARKLRKEKPVLAERVRSGDLTLLEAEKEIKKEKKEADEKERTIATEKLSKTMPSGGIVVHGDFRQIGESVADNSCTLIFTDPPYDRESLPLFESLGEFANRVLVDGGSLITFCGQYVMDEVIQSLGRHLRYFWICACLHTGDTAAMREYGIKVKWKPMLWYVKGNFRYDREVWVDDLVKSQQEKDYHPWQQSVIEAKHFIETLTRSGDLVCDPFCGGGTTAFAAKELGRKFWTCDVDARHIQTAKERLA